MPPRWLCTPFPRIFLGRNGYGKSYFLRLLVGLLSYDNGRLGALLPSTREDTQLTAVLLQKDEAASIEHDGEAFNEAIGKVPLLAIPDSRFINRAQDTVSAEGSDRLEPAQQGGQHSLSDLSRHGAHHFLYEKPYESSRLCTRIATKQFNRSRATMRLLSGAHGKAKDRTHRRRLQRHRSDAPVLGGAQVSS